MFGGQCWYGVMALDLFKSLTNPFRAPGSAMWRYATATLTLSLLSGAYLLSTGNVGWRSLMQTCWVKAVNDVNITPWITLFGPAAFFYLVNLVVTLYAVYRLRMGLRETFAVRLRTLLNGVRYTAAYTLYWVPNGVLYAIVSTGEGAQVRHVHRGIGVAFALFIGLQGVLDAAIWAYNEGVWSHVVRGAPVPASDINQALRREVLLFATTGIAAAAFHAANSASLPELLNDLRRRRRDRTRAKRLRRRQILAAARAYFTAAAATGAVEGSMPLLGLKAPPTPIEEGDEAAAATAAATPLAVRPQAVVVPVVAAATGDTRVAETGKSKGRMSKGKQNKGGKGSVNAPDAPAASPAAPPTPTLTLSGSGSVSGVFPLSAATTHADSASLGLSTPSAGLGVSASVSAGTGDSSLAADSLSLTEQGGLPTSTTTAPFVSLAAADAAAEAAAAAAAQAGTQVLDHLHRGDRDGDEEDEDEDEDDSDSGDSRVSTAVGDTSAPAGSAAAAAATAAAADVVAAGAFAVTDLDALGSIDPVGSAASSSVNFSGSSMTNLRTGTSTGSLAGSLSGTTASMTARRRRGGLFDGLDGDDDDDDDDGGSGGSSTQPSAGGRVGRLFDFGRDMVAVSLVMPRTLTSLAGTDVTAEEIAAADAAAAAAASASSGSGASAQQQQMPPPPLLQVNTIRPDAGTYTGTYTGAFDGGYGAADPTYGGGSIYGGGFDGGYGAGYDYGADAATAGLLSGAVSAPFALPPRPTAAGRDAPMPDVQLVLVDSAVQPACRGAPVAAADVVLCSRAFPAGTTVALVTAAGVAIAVATAQLSASQIDEAKRRGHATAAGAIAAVPTHAVVQPAARAGSSPSGSDHGSATPGFDSRPSLVPLPSLRLPSAGIMGRAYGADAAPAPYATTGTTLAAAGLGFTPPDDTNVLLLAHTSAGAGSGTGSGSGSAAAAAAGVSARAPPRSAGSDASVAGVQQLQPQPQPQLGLPRSGNSFTGGARSGPSSLTPSSVGYLTVPPQAAHGHAHALTPTHGPVPAPSVPVGAAPAGMMSDNMAGRIVISVAPSPFASSSSVSSAGTATAPGSGPSSSSGGSGPGSSGAGSATSSAGARGASTLWAAAGASGAVKRAMKRFTRRGGAAAHAMEKVFTEIHARSGLHPTHFPDTLSPSRVAFSTAVSELLLRRVASVRGPAAAGDVASPRERHTGADPGLLGKARVRRSARRAAAAASVTESTAWKTRHREPMGARSPATASGPTATGASDDEEEDTAGAHAGSKTPLNAAGAAATAKAGHSDSSDAATAEAKAADTAAAAAAAAAEPDAVPSPFVDYAPQVFRVLRALGGVSDGDYIASIQGKALSMMEKFTEGRSGSFFYFSEDQQLIVKSLSKEEAETLLSILPLYTHHLLTHRVSLLARIYGFHRIRLYNLNIYFLVMRNCLALSGPQRLGLCAEHWHAVTAAAQLWVSAQRKELERRARAAAGGDISAAAAAAGDIMPPLPVALSKAPDALAAALSIASVARAVSAHTRAATAHAAADAYAADTASTAASSGAGVTAEALVCAVAAMASTASVTSGLSTAADSASLGAALLSSEDPLPILERYDLKGSWVHRMTGPSANGKARPADLHRVRAAAGAAAHSAAGPGIGAGTGASAVAQTGPVNSARARASARATAARAASVAAVTATAAVADAARTQDALTATGARAGILNSQLEQRRLWQQQQQQQQQQRNAGRGYGQLLGDGDADGGGDGGDGAQSAAPAPTPAPARPAAASGSRYAQLHEETEAEDAAANADAEPGAGGRGGSYLPPTVAAGTGAVVAAAPASSSSRVARAAAAAAAARRSGAATGVHGELLAEPLLAGAVPVGPSADHEPPTSPGETTGGPGPDAGKGGVRKDNDLRRVIVMEPHIRKIFLDAIGSDSSFLQELGIMDYSLLLGLHWGSEAGTPSALALQRKIKTEADGLAPYGDAAPAAAPAPAAPVRVGNNVSLARLRPALLQHRPQSSISSKDVINDLPLAYFFGMIDILTAYDAKKRCEHLVKVYARCLDGRGISAVKPSVYRHRFIATMHAITRDATPAEMAAGVVPRCFGVEPSETLLLPPGESAQSSQAGGSDSSSSAVSHGAGSETYGPGVRHFGVPRLN
jgi:hypothetical protein